MKISTNLAGRGVDIRLGPGVAELGVRKYETIVEAQRLVGARRQRVLIGGGPELERLVTLQTIDDLWADYLTAVADLRADAVWISLGAANPFANYIVQVHAMFKAFEAAIDAEVPARLNEAVVAGVDPRERGATWTYLTTDEPFGHLTERIMRGLRQMIRRI